MTAWHDQTCTGCGATGARTQIDAELLCNPCTNRVLWGDSGLPLPPDPPPDELVAGPDGAVHQMRYPVGYTTSGPWAEALEVGGDHGDDFGGFQFRHWGTREQSFAEVLAALRARVRTEIGHAYVAAGHGRPGLTGTEVRGRIGDSTAAQRSELTVWIDGRPVPWSELGDMLRSFEGWQFDLRLE